SRSSRVTGLTAVLTGRVLYHDLGASRRRPGRRLVLRAVLLVRADADLAPLQEAVLEEELVVRLRDPHGRQEDRGRTTRLGVDALDLLVLEDGDGGIRCGGGLPLHRLVDRAGLPAGENDLDAGRRRVLARRRH